MFKGRTPAGGGPLLDSLLYGESAGETVSHFPAADSIEGALWSPRHTRLLRDVLIDDRTAV